MPACSSVCRNVRFDVVCHHPHALGLQPRSQARVNLCLVTVRTIMCTCAFVCLASLKILYYGLHLRDAFERIISHYTCDAAAIRSPDSQCKTQCTANCHHIWRARLCPAMLLTTQRRFLGTHPAVVTRSHPRGGNSCRMLEDVAARVGGECRQRAAETALVEHPYR